jgi:hypothetical protein
MWRNAYGQVTGIIGIELTLARSWPRRARYFWLDPKVSKKSSQQIGFFSLKSFALQNGQHHGCNYFAPLRPRLPSASAKTCYALSFAQGHHCSARFRPKLTC